MALADAGSRVPDNVRVYAIGDIHGRADLLRELLAKVRADADAAPRSERRQLIFLGDYVDRGPDSRGVLDILLSGLPQGFDPSFLCGNHEDLLLGFLDAPQQGLLFLRNGGDGTLRSYGIDVQSGDDLVAVRDRFLAALPKSHLHFLRTLSMQIVVGDYAFVHAGIRPGVPLEEQKREDLLWIRDEFLESTRDLGKVVVHGHTPMKEVEVTPNRIGLDTGAFATGRLTCLVLSGTERRILTT